MKKTLIILTILAAIGFGLEKTFSAAQYDEKDIRMEAIMNSTQFENGKFKNDEPWIQPGFGAMLRSMKKFFFEGNERTPKIKIPTMPANISHFNQTAKDQMNSTWVGHSSLLINLNGYKILTDPVYEKKLSIVGPTRYSGDVPLEVDELPEIDVVIISHNHYDHLNKTTIKKIQNRVKLFLTTLGVGAELEGWGVPREKIVELDWWDEYQVNEELMIAATPSQHFSGRGLSDRNKTLWASWVLYGPTHKIYFSSDSGYFDGFKKIGQKYGPFDLTFIECGAYNKNWHHIHMFPEESVQAHLDVRGKLMHPIHWGTFNLSTHAWFDPMERATVAAEKHGVQLATPIVGETLILDEYIPSKKWWEHR